MNLVSYEFVACQDAKKGVLILSEVILQTPSANIIAFPSMHVVLVLEIQISSDVGVMK